MAYAEPWVWAWVLFLVPCAIAVGAALTAGWLFWRGRVKSGG